MSFTSFRRRERTVQDHARPGGRRVANGERRAASAGELAAAPPQFVDLMEECWAQAPDDRPAFAEVFRRLDGNPDCVVAVAEVEGRVVGAATLLIEHKFINQAGRAGHIEDVAVAVGQQGSGVGSALIRYLLERAAAAGCYKTILDCADDVAPFYERFGFRRRTVGMDFRHR